MGVGYSASPLRRISYLDTSAPGRPAVPGEDAISDLLADISGTRVIVMDGPMRFHSPSKADILAWRDRIVGKYRDQLGEVLTWDEDSGFVESEDAATSADMLLRYVAAMFDQRGPVAVRALVGMAKPPQAELEPVFAEAARRGFSGRFPQLLLGTRYWLPFQRNLIIEEPNWLGHVERYGSAPRLADELKELRAFVEDAAPNMTAWTAMRPTPENDVLAAAWQASDTIARLCDLAVTRHLPLWTTG